MIKKAWQEQKEIKNVMLFLQSNGVSTAYAVRIYKTYGNDSIDIVKANPYRLADDIWGIGFKTADKIAQQLGFDKHSYERRRSGIIYVLNELSNEGHCFASRDQLLEAAEKMLEMERAHIDPAIDRMIEEKSVVPDKEDSIYTVNGHIFPVNSIGHVPFAKHHRSESFANTGTAINSIILARGKFAACTEICARA